MLSTELLPKLTSIAIRNGRVSSCRSRTFLLGSSSGTTTSGCVSHIINNSVVGLKRLYSQTNQLSSSSASSATKTVKITYVDPDGEEKTVDAEIGQNLLHVAHDNDIELEGACGAELACSTCHLIFDQEIFNKLPEMEEEEEDMLDLAFEVTETSRLGCQILVREDFDGMKVRIPDDGF